MLSQNAPITVLSEHVVASRPQGRHLAWPAAEVAANGDLLVAYKEATDHNRTDDAAVCVARSSDGGLTWHADRPVACYPGWACITSHGMTRLSDGTILLNIKVTQHYTDEQGQLQRRGRSHFTRSTDNGTLWDELGEALDASVLSPRHFGTSYGRLQETEPGLLVSFFGIPKGATDLRSRVAGVAFSSDGGRSWPESALIYEDRRGDICPSETDIIRLADGRFLAMIRANAALRLYRSYSADEGRTWSPIEPTELPGQCPALLTLASGQLLCAYRDMRPEQPGMSCAVSGDLGETWQPLGYLYKGANRDCAYPSMVHLPDGRIYCAFYTAASPDAVTGSSEIHGLLLEDRSAG